MKIYRFMEKRFVPGTLKGSIYFRSARYYRLLEICQDSEDIGDRDEATSRIFIPMVDPKDRAMLQSLARSGADDSLDATHPIICNVTIVNIANPFIGCFSIGPLEVLDDFKRTYDSGVEIVDDELFAEAISNATWNGRPLRENFNVLKPKPVEYTAETKTHEAGAFTSLPDPWLKRSRYKNQREYRICLEPLPGSSINADAISITLGAEYLVLLAPLGEWEQRETREMTALPRPEDALATLREFVDIFRIKPPPSPPPRRLPPELEPETLKWKKKIFSAYLTLRDIYPWEEMDFQIEGRSAINLWPQRIERYLSMITNGELKLWTKY